jgi:stringent starvation protein B
MQDMTPNQPYLLRAFFDWIIDNGLTPYMVVDVNFPNVQVPMQFVNDGQIVLNLSPSACVGFNMDLECIEFQARFSGQAMTVYFPCCAVAAIYAKENGVGSVFTVPEIATADTSTQMSEQKERPSSPLKSAPPPSAPAGIDSNKENSKKPSDKPSKKPGLRIVK